MIDFTYNNNNGTLYINHTVRSTIACQVFGKIWTGITVNLAKSPIYLFYISVTVLVYVTQS